MKTKAPPQSKLKGEKLAVFHELEARLAERPNPAKAVGQLRLLDVGAGEFAVRLPKVVLWLFDQAEAIDVPSATSRAKTEGISWQDMKATLELKVRLIRARAHWESEELDRANAELKQVAASPSSRRNELILAAAARTETEWNAAFSLALLRAAAQFLSNSLPAALAMVDALIGTSEQQAAALILGQLMTGWKDSPAHTRDSLAERISRLDPALRAPLEAALQA